MNGARREQIISDLVARRRLWPLLDHNSCRLCARPQRYEHYKGYALCWSCKLGRDRYGDALSDLVPITYTTRNWELGTGIREFKDLHGADPLHPLAERLGAVISAFLEHQAGRFFLSADPMLIPVPSSAPAIRAALERAGREGWWTPSLTSDAVAVNPSIPRQRDRDPGERATIEGKWLVDEDRLLGQHIVILDDMTTTGATFHSLARALRAVGAEAVKGVVLARNVGVGDETWLRALLDDAVDGGRTWTPHESKMDIIG